MTEDEPNYNAENLDELLSMRGKPFSDWKEERKYFTVVFPKDFRRALVNMSKKNIKLKKLGE